MSRMNRTMITAANTMGQLQQQLDVISHNLSNTNTTGYKSRATSFNDMLYQQVNNQEDKGTEKRLTPAGIRQGTGAYLDQTSLNMTQGAFENTDKLLDVAASNTNVYFQVAVNDSQQPVQYTRDGSFHLSPEGPNNVKLVNGSGQDVLGENGQAIIFSNAFKDIQIDGSGTITVTTNTGVEQFTLGLTNVQKPQMLEAKGENLFAFSAGMNQPNMFTDLIGKARDTAGVEQGKLEQSNVDLSKELTDMSIAQRAYQFNSRSISIADQMMGLVNGIRA